MKRIWILLAILWLGCADEGNHERDKEQAMDTVAVEQEAVKEDTSEKEYNTNEERKTYSNERFRDVTVERVGEHTFIIKGKGQIFEGNFGWVVEDGHNELKKGYQMTRAGAPEWGEFQFKVNVRKRRENSTLHIILFESSPKDGSRQHELPVLLY